MKSTTRLFAATLAALAGSQVAHASLQARDIDHDGLVDAYYDAQFDRTWLADANLVKKVGFPSQWEGTSMPHPDANGAVIEPVAWSYESYFNSLPGIDGASSSVALSWRLPTLSDASVCTPVGSHAICSHSVVAGSSELENLLTVTLGNHGQLTNTGPFINLAATAYLTDKFVTGNPPSSGPYWTYNPGTGVYNDSGSNGVMWFVHTGDVGVAIAPSVPEPGTLAMLLAGAAALVARRTRRA